MYGAVTNEKSVVQSKIIIVSLLGILLPYINEYLSSITGAPVVIQPDAAYQAILMAIIILRALWTDAKVRLGI